MRDEGRAAFRLGPEDDCRGAASRMYEKLADKAYPRSLMVDIQKALAEYQAGK